ncbi:MAG TPA: glycosyltransferase family 4 protein [Planctomycetaceae bacterium]|nr:glycosyltransferase family 4 protein [Planctomycetaceae bacterium]
MEPPPLRIRLVNLFFGAETAPTGALAESLACELERCGCDVEVHTGTAEYLSSTSPERSPFRGRVRYISSGRRPTDSVRGRLRTWLRFYCGAAWRAWCDPAPDIVVAMTTPPFLHAIYVLVNRLRGRPTRIVVWNQDTFPEILAAAGLLRRDSALHHRLLTVQRWSLAGTWRVVALDHAMAERLRELGARDVRVIPNWATHDASEEVESLPTEWADRMARIRREFRWCVLYSGNYGWGHRLESVGTYLRTHAEQRDFYFLCVGGGERWPQLVDLERETSGRAIGVHPYVPRSVYRQLLQAVDFGLIALERECSGLMSPSKLHSYLSAGKPVLYLGPPESNVGEAIAEFGCGVRIDEIDPAAFAVALDDIANGRVDVERIGEGARRAAVERYSAAAGLREWRRFLGIGEV